jgi:hemolysin activation/secretion protein
MDRCGPDRKGSSNRVRIALCLWSSMLVLPPGIALAQQAPDDTTGGGTTGGPDPAREDALRFDVMEYLVQGNTVLPVVDIEEAVYPYLGPGKTIADVEGARAALEQRYNDRGYVTVAVSIPEQSVGSGIVRLDVAEGRVGRLRVRNSRYYSLGRIKEAAPSLAEGTVPNTDAVERDTDVLNRLPGRRVTPLLRGGVEPGTVDADLNVEDTAPWRADIELNNQYSADTDPLRLATEIGYDNLFQLGHSLSLQYTVSPGEPSNTSVFGATYIFRVPEWEQSLLVYGIKSNSDVSTLGDTSVVGDGEIVGARAILPLPPLGDFSHTLVAGFDYKDFNESSTIGNDTDNTNETPIAYFPATFDYSATLNDGSGSTRAHLGGVFNIAGLSDSAIDFEKKRAGSSPNFAYAKFGVERLQDLPAEFQLLARVEAQLSDGPLISNEQFGIGGVSTVRGYLESEEFGDSGVAGTLQIDTPDLSDKFGDSVAEQVQSWTFHVFGDVGHTVLDDVVTLPDGERPDDSFTLASIGLGSEIELFNHLTAGIDVALPLLDGSETGQGDVRVLFFVAAGL